MKRWESRSTESLFAGVIMMVVDVSGSEASSIVCVKEPDTHTRKEAASVIEHMKKSRLIYAKYTRMQRRIKDEA